MVRLLNDKNLGIITDMLCFWFNLQKHVTFIENVNPPEDIPCIFAMWHAHQCCLYGLPAHIKQKTNVMISTSKDGSIIAETIKRVFNFKLIRGSTNREGAVRATVQMIDALKAGENGAIMVDGPRGPLHSVKKGIIRIAKHSGVPIIPVRWYSSNFNFLKLPSWDKFEMPIGYIRIINLYGKPIYVPADADKETEKRILSELKQSLEDIDKNIHEEYKKRYWFGLWRKKI